MNELQYLSLIRRLEARAKEEIVNIGSKALHIIS